MILVLAVVVRSIKNVVVISKTNFNLKLALNTSTYIINAISDI